MTPVSFVGSRFLIPAVAAAAKSIPTQQLARWGLLRGPLVGLGPTVGAFLGGAALVALVVPGSRAWVKGQATRALELAKEWGAAQAKELINEETGDGAGGPVPARSAQRRVRVAESG